MCTRQDRVHHRNRGFEVQMSAMIDAYMLWDEKLGDAGLGAATPPPEHNSTKDCQLLLVVDVFREFSFLPINEL